MVGRDCVDVLSELLLWKCKRDGRGGVVVLDDDLFMLFLFPFSGDVLEASPAAFRRPERKEGRDGRREIGGGMSFCVCRAPFCWFLWFSVVSESGFAVGSVCSSLPTFERNTSNSSS